MSVIGLPNAQEGLQTLKDVGQYRKTSAESNKLEEDYRDLVANRENRRAEQAAKSQENTQTSLMTKERTEAVRETGFHTEEARLTAENKTTSAYNEKLYNVYNDVKSESDWRRKRAAWDGTPEEINKVFGEVYDQDQMDGWRERALNNYNTAQTRLAAGDKIAADVLIARWNLRGALAKSGAARKIDPSLKADRAPAGTNGEWKAHILGLLGEAPGYDSWNILGKNEGEVQAAAQRAHGTFLQLYGKQAVEYNAMLAANVDPVSIAHLHPDNMITKFAAQSVAIDVYSYSEDGGASHQSIPGSVAVKARTLAYEASINPGHRLAAQYQASNMTVEAFAFYIAGQLEGLEAQDEGATP